MSLKLSGVTLGDITGGPSSLNLYDLADVSIVSPQTGQYLRYNGTISEWQNAYINSDVYDYLDGAMSGTQGVSLTFTPGPNTIAIGLGNITPTSVAASGTVTGSNLSGTNTGDQTITLTGDVTGSGTGSFPTTLATVNASPQSNAFRRITVDGKGLVTSTSAVTSGNITTALGYTPVNIAGDTMTGYLILNADPTTALGAVTKQYVDTVAAGLNVHASCVTATTATLASSSGGTVTYNNGASGVGATLTTTGSFATIGGASTANTDRILVKNEATAANNGIYVRTSSTVLTRAGDFDNSPSGEISAGDFTFISSGTLVGTNWVQTTPAPITVGTTAINFTQLSGPGVYVGGTGIDVTGNVISNTGVTSAVAGSNISVSAATGAVTFSVTGTVPTATSAATTTIVDDTTTNATMYPVWVTTTTGNLPLKVSSTQLSFVPNTGALTVAGSGRFNGATQGTLGVLQGTGSTATANSAADDFIIDGSGSSGMSILTSNTSTGSIYFGSTTSAVQGGITYNHSTDTLTFRTSAAIQLSITNLLTTSSVPVFLNPGASTGTVTSAAGSTLRISPNIFTDSSTAASGTISVRTAANIAIPTFAATNTAVTYTNASSLFIAGSASPGTNVTLTNTHALHVASGRTFMAENGSASIPTLAVRDVDTGLYSSATGTLNITLAGTLAATFAASGPTFVGTATATAFNATSTARVKDAIVDIGKSYLDKFKLLKPREYDRRDYAAHEFGFIAEEMALVYPEVVGCDNNGMPTGIDYGKLSTILTAKIQEQQTIIEQLQTQVSTIMGLLQGSK